MTVAFKADSVDTRRLLEVACARNLSAEMHWEGWKDRAVGRLRLLAIDDRHVYTDMPRFDGPRPEMSVDQQVLIYFLCDGNRYVFRTRIADPWTSVRLNAKQRVAGVALRIPDRISTQQRRADYRVSLAAGPVDVRLHEVDPNDMTLCPILAARFTGRIANLSAGGFGVFVQQVQRGVMEPGERYCAQFALPGEPDPMVLFVEVRNVRTNRDRKVHLVGMRFLPCAAVRTARQIAAVQRFIVAEQLRQIRARK